MKTSVLLSFLMPILLFTACKDEPTPFEKPETGMFFNGVVNNYEKAMIESQNGYRFISNDSCVSISNGISFFCTNMIFQGNSNYYMSNRESFGLNYFNLFDTVMTNRDSVINQYFVSPMPFAYIDTTSSVPNDNIFGVEITWIDGKGDYYTTLYTPQTGSLNLDLYSMSMGAIGRNIKVEASFSCTLYSPEEKKTITLTDGITRIISNTTCF